MPVRVEDRRQGWAGRETRRAKGESEGGRRRGRMEAVDGERANAASAYVATTPGPVDERGGHDGKG